MEDRVIRCVQCDSDFEFSRLEQRLFFEKGFDMPKRCPECRRNKKSEREDEFDWGMKPMTRRKKKGARRGKRKDSWNMYPAFDH